MPFEPRIHKEEESAESQPSIVRPEEPVWNDGELLDLPDDLSALAEQLRDDAVYLAEKHPADATSEERELAWKEFVESKSTTPTYAFGRRWVTAAAALAVLFAVGGWALYMNQPSGIDPNTHAAGEAATAAVSTPDRTPSADNLKQTNPPKPVEPAADGPRLIPASFLRDVSGPELDGMLDLLEEDESGLSI